MTYEQLASATSAEMPVVEPSPEPPPPEPPPSSTVTIEYDTNKIYYEDRLDSMMKANGVTDADKSAYFIRQSVS